MSAARWVSQFGAAVSDLEAVGRDQGAEFGSDIEALAGIEVEPGLLGAAGGEGEIADKRARESEMVRYPSQVRMLL